MGAKENLNEAMFSMFGVGKAPESATAAEPAVSAAPAAKPVVAKAAAKPAAPAANTTYLAPGSYMEGSLKCKGDIHIAGIFKGNVESESKVIICADMTGNIIARELELSNCHLVGDIIASGSVLVTDSATVEGKISAGELVCAGQVKGDLEVKGNVVLKAGTSVNGNIVTGTMSMEAGAFINGSVEMNVGGQKSKVEAVSK